MDKNDFDVELAIDTRKEQEAEMQAGAFGEESYPGEYEDFRDNREMSEMERLTEHFEKQPNIW